MFVRATLTEVPTTLSNGERGNDECLHDSTSASPHASLPNTIATFGPISIAPAYQRTGYGLRLLQYALERAREMGIGAVCMEGNINFYKHAGFTLASRLGIHYHCEPLDAEVPYFLAQELIPGYLSSPTLRGRKRGNLSLLYTPPRGYFAAIDQPEAFAAYEAIFPPKEKKVLPTQLFPE